MKLKTNLFFGIYSFILEPEQYVLYACNQHVGCAAGNVLFDCLKRYESALADLESVHVNMQTFFTMTCIHLCPHNEKLERPLYPIYCFLHPMFTG